MEGLGLRELETFNEPFLTKMTARIVNKPEALWVRTINGLYFPNTEFRLANKGGKGIMGLDKLDSRSGHPIQGSDVANRGRYECENI